MNAIEAIDHSMYKYVQWTTQQLLFNIQIYIDMMSPWRQLRSGRLRHPGDIAGDSPQNHLVIPKQICVLLGDPHLPNFSDQRPPWPTWQERKNLDVFHIPPFTSNINSPWKVRTFGDASMMLKFVILLWYIMIVILWVYDGFWLTLVN